MIRVVDGDTIKIKGASGEMTVRLVGIDAPEVSHKKREPGQPFNQQATKHLAGLVLNKTVDIKEYGQDRCGRILHVVSLAGKNIKLEMLEEGFAEVYLRDYETVPALHQGLKRYFTFYNSERPHQSLGYLTPAEVHYAH